MECGMHTLCLDNTESSQCICMWISISQIIIRVEIQEGYFKWEAGIPRGGSTSVTIQKSLTESQVRVIEANITPPSEINTLRADLWGENRHTTHIHISPTPVRNCKWSLGEIIIRKCRKRRREGILEGGILAHNPQLRLAGNPGIPRGRGGRRAFLHSDGNNGTSL